MIQSSYQLRFFSILLTACAFAQASSLVLKTTDFASQKNALTTFLEKPAVLESLTFDVDVPCSSQELQELTMLSPGTTISGNDILTAVEYLIKKNKFKTITLTQEATESGLILRFALESYWTLAHVKIKGVSIGRDRFRQYYLLEPGDPFDYERHCHSLENVKEALTSQGYCAARVQGIVHRDELTKSINVTLKLHLKDRFSIGDISVDWQALEEGVEQESVAELSRALEQRFCSRLRAHRYSKILLNRQAQWLKEQLHHRGFFHSDIELIETIHPERNAVDLQIKVMLHKPRSLVFFGNQFFSSSRLLDQLEVFGAALCMLPPSALVRELVQLYHQKGYFKTKVAVQEEKNQSIFLIDEGARTSIQEITFQGVTHFSYQHLIRRCFSSVFKKNNFDSDKLTEAFNALISCYHEEGFWDARIVCHELQERFDTGHSLSVTVDEGAVCRIGSIILDTPFHCLECHPVFTRATDKPCSVRLLKEQRELIEQEGLRQGIKIHSIKPVFTRTLNLVRVQWKIKTSESADRFGNIVLMDSPPFPYEYIKRELVFAPGQPFSTEKIKQSVARLKDLEIFESIHISPAARTEQGDRPMLVKVYLDDPHELKLRWGFGFQQMSTKFTFRSLTYSFGGVFKIKNPFEKADQISVDVDYKRGMHSAVLTYRQPWIYNKPLDFRFEGYTIEYLQPGWVELQHNLYAILQQGFMCALMHKKPWLSVGMNVGCEWMKTRTTGPSPCDNSFLFNMSLARALNFVPSLLDHYVPYIMAQPTLSVDLTNSKVDPTSGTFTLITLKTMVPLTYRNVASYFVKLFLQQSVYIPFHPLLIMLGLRAGHIFQRNFSSIMPSERFYLGGANSIRSYQTDGCPPLGTFCNEYGQTVFVPQGARSMICGNVEVRFPLHNRLDGAFFQDLGALNNTAFTQIRAHDILAGSGFGLRYATPVGPLRFDIAWKWGGREPRSITPFAWYVTFGSVF